MTDTCDFDFVMNPRNVSSTNSQGEWFQASAPESCSPVVCNKSEFEKAKLSTVSVGCPEEVSRFEWVSLDARIQYTCQEGFTTTGETSGGTLELREIGNLKDH